MKTTFHPNDIFQSDGVVAHKLENGSLFVGITNGEQVYVPSKIVEHLNVAEGDGLRCYCVPNPPEHGFNAKWKAIRCMVTHRLIEADARTVVPSTPVAPVKAVATLANPTVAAPTESPMVRLDGPELEAVIDTIIDRAEVFSVKEIYTEICKANPPMWKDTRLQGKVNSALMTMWSRGDVACARLYSNGSQQNATALYYARTVELIIAHMKGEMR